MNCQEARELVEESIDNSLTGGTRRLLELHLQRCPSCRERFEAERREHVLWFRLSNDVSDIPPPTPGFDERLLAELAGDGWRRRFRLPRWARIAAALALIASFVSYAAFVATEPSVALSEGKEAVKTTNADIGEYADLFGTDGESQANGIGSFEKTDNGNETKGAEDMKANIGAALAAAAIQTTALTAVAEPEYLYLNLTGGGNNFSWTDASGNPATWSAGNWAVWTHTPNDNTSPNLGLDMYGMVFSTDALCKGFWLDAGWYKIGAGGVTFEKQGYFTYGKSDGSQNVTLTADQEWKGTQSGTGRSSVSLGCFWYGSYYNTSPAAAASVADWKISGLLDVWIGGKCSSNFSGIRVTVESPARLALVQKYTKYGTWLYPAARLGAKRLVLKGDGWPLLTGSTSHFSSAVEVVHGVRELTPVTVASEIELADGADLELEDGCFAIPTAAVSGTGATESVVTGTFSNNLACTSLQFSDGATLFLDAAISDGAAGSSAIAATGDGVLKIAIDKYAATGAITLGEDTELALVGNAEYGRSIVGGAGLSVDPGDGVEFYLSGEQLSGFTGSRLTVRSGTLILDSASVLPPDCSVVEAGGTVVYADAPGALVVGNAVRSDAELTVGEGQTLTVYGSGLTDATSLKVKDGGRVLFRRSATISSPVTVTGTAAVFESADAGVAGRVVGPIVTSVDIRLIGSGVLELAGGATFSNDASLLAGEGTARLSGGEFRFDRGKLFVGSLNARVEGGSWVGDWCRRLVVGDGATVSFGYYDGASRNVIEVYPVPDGSAYRREAVLEIAAGGSVLMPGNADAYLGNNQNIGTIHLNGGRLKTGSYGYIYLGAGDYATGRLILDSGILDLDAPLVRAKARTAQSYVTWNGGTIRIGSTWTRGEDCLFVARGSVADGTTLRTSVEVAGEDCVIDLAGCPSPSIVNMPAKFEAAFNEWWGHGRLTVKGGGELVMQSFMDGIRLAIEGDGTRVTIPSEARVYDYETCKVNCRWREPYGSSSTYNVTNSWLDSVSFGSFVVGGTNCAFTCARASTTVTSTNVTVSATGVWGLGDGTLPSAMVIKDITFADGATWKPVSLPMQVPGRLAFGETLKVDLSGVPTLNNVMATAQDGVSGDPDTTFTTRCRHARLIVETVNGRVLLERAGAVLLIR